MANHMEELGIVVRADGTVELANGMKLTADQISAVGKKLDEHGRSLQGAEKGQKAVTASTKEMGQALGQAGDKAVQVGKDLANGQWKQVAADLAATAIQGRVLVGTMALVGGVLAVMGGAVGVIAYAAYRASEAERELNDQLQLTGNFAGLVAGQLDAMAGSVARNINAKVSSSRDVLASLNATGRFTVQSLEDVGQAALMLQRYTGQSTDQVVQQFTRMSKDVVKSSAELNESVHFLTLEKFKYIKALADAGNKQEAMRVSAEALSRHLGGDMTNNLSTLGGWLDIVSRKWDTFWESAKNRFKTPGTNDLLADSSTYLEQIQKGWLAQTPGGQAKIEAEKGRNFGLLRRSERERRTADDSTAQMQADAAAIAKLTEKKPKGPSEDNHAENYLARLEKQVRSVNGESSAYADVMEHLTINAKAFNFEQFQTAAAYALVIDAQRAKKVVDAAEQKNLQETWAAREKDTAAWLDYEAAMRESLRDREFEISLIGKTAEQVARLTTAYTLEKAARTSATSVRAARESGAISSPEEEARRLAAIAENTRRHMVLSNNQLAEQFKPGWEKMVEGWRDSTQLMKESHDDMMTGIVQNGEDMWVEFARTGKLNARNMVDGILAEFMRLQYRQFVAGLMNSGGGGGGLAGAFMQMLGGGAGNGMAGLGQVNSTSGEFMGSLEFHTGGIVGSSAAPGRRTDSGVFAGAPRFHGGGVAGDEVPIIAKKGEGIFTKEQMANLQPAGGGQQLIFSPTINIDARTDKGEVEELVFRGMQAAQVDLLEKMARRQV